MAKYILAIDQGTTSSRAILFDASLQIHGKATAEFPQHFPKPGHVEHDLADIWDSVCTSVRQAMAQSGARGQDIAAIGITNQRETTCLWHRDAQATPLTRAIVWQDRRTSAECEALRRKKLGGWIAKKTGLVIDPYFSATKLQWMLKNVSGAAKMAQDGKLAFGTIDSYLLYRLSGEHRTDVSNASRTMLMDLKTCDWDPELLKLFRIPKSVLPEILPSATEYGKTRRFLDFPDGIPITGIAGDQQAALFGQTCFSKGGVKCTYGTGAFAMLNTGHKPVFSKNRLVTTVAWKLGGQTTYALEGSSFIAGAAVQFLRDGLQLIPSSPSVEALAASVEDNGGVTFVPALSGLGAPHWVSTATGLMTGLTRGTTKAHVARATLEGIAFQVSELLTAMAKDYGSKPKALKVDGGASADDLLMQFQADLLGMRVTRAAIMETTALGAALQAGLAVGYWSGLDDIATRWKASRAFESKMKPTDRKKRLDKWARAVEAVKLLS
ncbi:glycerol kinase GlpK [bacterium]|nr:glycerol kinase GlpK [bacterium]